MNREDAQSAVTLSALAVGLMFAYRKAMEQGSGSSPSTSHFVIGFGFAFFVISIVAEAAPELGGMLALLVATGDLLINGQSVFKDLNSQLAKTATKPAAGSSTSSTVPAEQPEQPEQAASVG